MGSFVMGRTHHRGVRRDHGVGDRIQPAAPARAILRSSSPATTRKPAQIAEVAHRYGLDQPLYIQYVDWASQCAVRRSRPFAVHQRAGARS